MADNTMIDLDIEILSHFRRDTLCGGCGGPVEKNRVHTCWKCDTMAHVRTQLNWIDAASMNLAIKLGIRQPPPPVRVVTPISEPTEVDPVENTIEGTEAKAENQDETIK